MTQVVCSWTYRKKWISTIIVSLFTFISPVSSSMVAPASDAVAAQLNITNDVINAMTTSIFILGYGGYRIPLSYTSHWRHDSRWTFGLSCHARGLYLKTDQVPPTAVRSIEWDFWPLSSSATREYVVSRCVSPFLSRILHHDIQMQHGTSAVVFHKVQVSS